MTKEVHVHIDGKQVTKSISAAQRAKDPKAGPHGSFPLDPEHLKAAWDLAGHAKNPAAIRAKVRAYAKAHGMEDHLPESARDGEKASKPKSGMISKAKNADLTAVVHQAYHATMPGSYERNSLVRGIHKRGLLEHLPSAAHTDLHTLELSHNHPDMSPESGIVHSLAATQSGEDEEDTEHGHPMMHEHLISKAFNPKASFGRIVKSWQVEGAEDQYIEGWLSTPDRDLEKDITEPEAFKDGPLQEYFARSAPLSLEHGTNTLPAGHLQRAAILRDGKVLEEAEHPTDPHAFDHLPTSGSGVWARGVLTDEPARSAVRKGNVGGMSFTGNYTQYTRIPGGGKRFHKIDPLLESTVAAYPANPKAVFKRVQKALGLSDSQVTQETQDNMEDDLDFEALMAEAAERVARKAAEAQTAAADAQVQKSITPEQMADMLSAFETRLNKQVEERVQKAISAQVAIPPRGEGVGRKGLAPASEQSADDALDADPLNYLIKKANAGEEYTQREKEVAGKIWAKALQEGMAYAGNDED